MTYAYGERGDEEANIVNGLLTSQTYGNGDKVSFTYDDLGRNKTTTYSDGRVLTYAYTGDGQLYSIHDSKTQYTYVYTYDSIGRLIASCVKSGGTVLMQTRQEYDANNQMTAQHWTVGDTTYSQTFTYNKQEGMVTAMTTGNGHSIQLEYDALRRLSKVDTTTLDRNYTYVDVSDSQTTGQVSSFYYTTTNGGSTYFNYGYTYDVLGNISSYTQSGTTYSYTYDAQNQLKTQTGGGKTYTYTYDNAGNILTASNGTTTNSYTYGNAIWKDQLTAFNGQTITYDGSGNPLSYYNGKRYTFNWEEGRNLVSAVQGTNTYTYAYDQNGIRVSKVENGKTHTYLYASGKLLRETISVGNAVTDTLDFFYDHNGYPCELNHTTNGTTTTYYYITNLQGDVLCMITGNGTSVASYSYDPYGKVLTATGEMANINPLRYRGYYYDAETGFYYLQSRYYDPSICRFINADCYVSTGQGVLGDNMFAYCLNSPVVYVDSDGKDAVILYDSDIPGHIGVLVQDEDGKWWHFYWGTTGWLVRAICVIGVSVPVTTWCEEYTGEIDIESINDSQQFSGDYESLYYLEGDFSECVDIFQNSSEWYNLYTNNCSQKTLRVLSRADTDYKWLLMSASLKVLPGAAAGIISMNLALYEFLDTYQAAREN